MDSGGNRAIINSGYAYHLKQNKNILTLHSVPAAAAQSLESGWRVSRQAV